MTRTRKVVTIDEAKCNGCGQCVSGCAALARAVIDARDEVLAGPCSIKQEEGTR